MTVLKRRIARCASAEGVAPKVLTTLPELSGLDNITEDAWGRPIRMSVIGSRVTLVSLGRDGAAGGTGDDADMSGTFSLRNEDGSWAREDATWIEDPLTAFRRR